MSEAITTALGLAALFVGCCVVIWGSAKVIAWWTR